MARAMMRFRSGGYAAVCRDTQEPSGALAPPHRRLKVGKLGSDSRRDHERCELLSVGAERAHGEGDARCVVPAAQVRDVG
eukprot:1791576-Pleurochrysis_carterae.AAC.1